MRYLLLLSIIISTSLQTLAQASPGASPEDRLKSELARTLIMANLGLNAHPQNIQIESQTVVATTLRSLTRVILKTESVGRIELYISAPQAFTELTQPLPVLFIMSGFQAGGQTVKLLKDPGPVILVGYQYAISEEEALKSPNKVGEALRLTPGQVSIALGWVSHQPWALKNQVAAMGVSLGSLFLPVSLRLAEAQGTRVQSTILAYGGADLGLILENELKAHLGTVELASALSLARWLTALHEPDRHLPFLTGRFLLIRATHDEIFPEISGDRLESLTPEPKQVVRIEGGHINSDKADLIDQTARAVKQWLGF